MNRILLLVFLCFAIQISRAQAIFVSGKVSNRQGTAISMATVVVEDSTDKFVKGCISDSLGSFNIEVTRQAYNLHVSCVGYKDSIYKIDCNKQPLYIQAVLDTATNDLGEVVILSKKPLIHRGLDRITLDAEKLNAVATNFLDVLKRTPGVLVQDDAITMINKGKVVCLMNGRELNMDMATLVNYLSSLNSDNLKAIEVMTTPPAKYSAEGDAGVINFVTRKIKNDYFSGNISNRLSIKERTYDGMGFGVQYKHDKLEAYANAGLGMGTMQTDSKSQVIYPTEKWLSTHRRLKSNNYVLVTSGLDYDLTKSSSVGMILSYNNMKPDADVTSETKIYDAVDNSKIGNYRTFTNNNNSYNRYNANIHYINNKIGKDGTLSINADLLKYDINDAVELQSTQDESLAYMNHPQTNITIYQLKADMEMPVGSTVLSYGGALSRSKTDNRTDYLKISNGENLDDHFLYNENIFAAYADVRYKFTKQLEGKAGLRAEYGRLCGNSLKMDTLTVKRQLDLFPTLYLNYRWNDNNSLSLSASSRINRPNYSDINPFTTYIDAHTLQTGNPSLLPEKSYSIEIGYTHKDFSVSASTIWKRHAISTYTNIDETKKMTTMTIDNVMNKQLYSLDFSYYLDKFAWFDSDIEGSFYTIKSEPYAGLNLKSVNSASTFFYINNNIYFNRSKTLTANLWGQYQGKERDILGSTSSRYRVDLGIKYLLFNKRLSVGLKYQNMIASHIKSRVESNSNSSIYDFKPFRVVNITVSYRFGRSLGVRQKQFGIDNDRL